MSRPRKNQTPTVEEVKDVLPNKEQAPKQVPMQGMRKLNAARKATGTGWKMGNLMGLQARPSPYGGQNNA